MPHRRGYQDRPQDEQGTEEFLASLARAYPEEPLTAAQDLRLRQAFRDARTERMVWARERSGKMKGLGYRIAAASLAAAMVGGPVAAYAGVLPDPVQEAVHEAASRVGVEVPRGRQHRAEVANPGVGDQDRVRLESHEASSAAVQQQEQDLTRSREESGTPEAAEAGQERTGNAGESTEIEIRNRNATEGSQGSPPADSGSTAGQGSGSEAGQASQPGKP